MTALRTLALFLWAATTVSAQTATSTTVLPVQGRSIIQTKFGIVATSQPLASMAGVQILERGGNAIDAAIAANSTLGLMEPTSNGIGGDLFAIVYDAKTHSISVSGRFPSRPFSRRRSTTPKTDSQ